LKLTIVKGWQVSFKIIKILKMNAFWKISIEVIKSKVFPNLEWQKFMIYSIVTWLFWLKWHITISTNNIEGVWNNSQNYIGINYVVNIDLLNQPFYLQLHVIKCHLQLTLGHFCNYLLCLVILTNMLQLVCNYCFFHASKRTTFCLVFI